MVVGLNSFKPENVVESSPPKDFRTALTDLTRKGTSKSEGGFKDELSSPQCTCFKLFEGAGSNEFSQDRSRFASGQYNHLRLNPIARN